MQMMEQPEESTYALYADKGQLERGKHPYFLAMSCRRPFQAEKGSKDAWGCIIAVRTWVLEIYWLEYASHLQNPNHRAC